MTVIDVQNVSKKYVLYHSHQSAYTTIVETLTNKFNKYVSKIRHPFDKTRQVSYDHYEEFWALKDVSMQVQEGDRVAIIGRNGSGKSTLLKLLSRITDPTEGKITIRGRVTSLLEVGTGFHPELSGRENIFLNGAILGMKKHEIKRKFDEIVAFSEVEKFLDTPVKRYSSGMYTRLGFSIAAHLDPDLLIIDEVLSVGDAPFQKKCLQKLNELGRTGRTVLFVSHDVGAVSALCNKGIYLENGQVQVSGDIELCVSKYMPKCPITTLEWTGNVGDEHIRFLSARLVASETHKREHFYKTEQVSFEIEYEVLQPHPDFVMGIGIWDLAHHQLARSYVNDDFAHKEEYFRKGKHRISFAINNAMLQEGDYLLKVDCVVQNLKRIVGEEIAVKYPLYTTPESFYSGIRIQKEGIFLGQNWHREAFDG